jgi:hypothetical protein
MLVLISAVFAFLGLRLVSRKIVKEGEKFCKNYRNYSDNLMRDV